MEKHYTPLTRTMITSGLVGKKVVRLDRTDEANPVEYTVVTGNQQTGYVWVTDGTGADPVRFQATALALTDYPGELTKTMKWHGKTLGALEKFCEQARVEGGDDDTKLNPDDLKHVALVVRLPLATKPQVDSMMKARHER